MEASALPASVGLARTRIAIAAPLLRLRSDEQLVSLFRAGNEDAFRAIHDRYRTRMLAYTRQMLAGSPQDPEDAVQEVFVRAYAGLRANHRELALRAWLYRIAHNRCIDELRRAHPPALEAIDALIPAIHDPLAKVEERDSLRRLIVDVRRLPEQQRSALLMRELSGMAYADVAGALGVSVPAVKSLLVRARIGLAQASEARDTACAEIREDLISSHDRGVRTSGLARRHIRDCSSCRQFRSEIRGVSRRFAALTPTLGPLGVVANLLGWGGGGGGAAAGGGAVTGGGAAAAGSGAAASAGVLAGGAGHVVTLLAAAIVATGGAVEIQHTLGTPNAHRAHHHRIVSSPRASTASQEPNEPTSVSTPPASTAADIDPVAPAPPAVSSANPARPAAIHQRTTMSTPGSGAGDARHNPTQTMPISQTLDPDNMTAVTYPSTNPPGATNPASPGASTTGATPGSGSTGSSPTGGTGSSSSRAGGGTTGTPGSGTTGATGTGSTTGGSSSGTGAPGTSAGSAPTGSSSPATGTATSPVVAGSSSTGATKLSTFVSQGP